MANLYFSGEQLDPTRAALCVGSYIGPNNYAAVHFSRIASLAERFGQEEQVISTLETLSLLREAQHVGDGYWVPTPDRLISLATDESLIISSSPTEHIIGRYGASTKIVGAGRSVRDAQCASASVLAVSDWMAAPEDTIAWAREMFKRAVEEMRETTQTSQGVAVFAPWLKVRNPSKSSTLWRLAEEVTLAENQVVICRTVTDHRWFFAKFSGRRIEFEAPITADKLRLLYATCVEVGYRTTVPVRMRDGLLGIGLSAPLPDPEERLVYALSRLTDPETKHYTFRPRHLPLLQTYLGTLGLDLKEAK